MNQQTAQENKTLDDKDTSDIAEFEEEMRAPLPIHGALAPFWVHNNNVNTTACAELQEHIRPSHIHGTKWRTTVTSVCMSRWVGVCVRESGCTRDVHAGFPDDAIDLDDQTYYNPLTGDEERNQWQCLPHQWHPRAPCTSVGHRIFWVNHHASPFAPDFPSEAWFEREQGFRTDPPRIHNWFPTEESPVGAFLLTPFNPARYATQRVALTQQYTFHTT